MRKTEKNRKSGKEIKKNEIKKRKCEKGRKKGRGEGAGEAEESLKKLCLVTKKFIHLHHFRPGT